MLKQPLRLRAEDFSRKPVRIVSSARFAAKIFKRRTGRGRFAVVVSSRVEPQAVRRHLLKRRVMAIVRIWLPTDADVALFALPAARGASSGVLRHELGQLFTKISSSVK